MRLYNPRRIRRRRYKRRMLRHVGFPITYKGPCKTVTLGTSTQNEYDTQFIYSVNITTIARDTTVSTGINLRSRDVVNLSGIKLRWFFQNRLNAIPQVAGGLPAYPLYVNMALLSWNDPDVDLGADFFRVNSDKRSLDFSDGTLNGWDRAVLPVNADENNVIWHTRFILGCGTTGQTYGTNEVKTYKRMSRYIKIRRQVRYAGESASSCTTPIYLVWWCSSPAEANNTVNPKALQINPKIEVFFREPE